MKKAFANPVTEAYIDFFVSALPLFTSCNLFIKRSDPLPYFGYPITKDLIQKMCKRFLKLDAVRDLATETLENEENYLC